MTLMPSDNEIRVQSTMERKHIGFVVIFCNSSSHPSSPDKNSLEMYHIEIMNISHDRFFQGRRVINFPYRPAWKVPDPHTILFHIPVKRDRRIFRSVDIRGIDVDFVPEPNKPGTQTMNSKDGTAVAD